MEFIMVKQKKATLEQQMQLYETIKGERDLLKENQEKEDAKYWALKKELDNLEIMQFCMRQRKSPMTNAGIEDKKFEIQGGDLEYHASKG